MSSEPPPLGRFIILGTHCLPPLAGRTLARWLSLPVAGSRVVKSSLQPARGRAPKAHLVDPFLLRRHSLLALRMSRSYMVGPSNVVDMVISRS